MVVVVGAMVVGGGGGGCNCRLKHFNNYHLETLLLVSHPLPPHKWPPSGVRDTSGGTEGRTRHCLSRLHPKSLPPSCFVFAYCNQNLDDGEGLGMRLPFTVVRATAQEPLTSFGALFNSTVARLS